MKKWVEFTAKTVSDALTEASVSLKVQSSMIEYEVIEEEKSGLLGFFSKPAKIRVCLKEEGDSKTEDLKTINIVKDRVIKNNVVKEKTEISNEEIDVEGISKRFLKDVFDAMNIEATILVSFHKEEGIVNIDIEGKDMGILIGKRGQTLDSLQYLTSLVINKETSNYLKVKMDTENYRERRKETLENLARNIAFKVKRTKRSVSLEPMNPYERRIIHSALQGDKFVETHSEGEEPYRKVVITMKKGYRDYGNKYNQSDYRYNNNKRDYSKKNFSERETTEVKTEK